MLSFADPPSETPVNAFHCFHQPVRRPERGGATQPDVYSSFGDLDDSIFAVGLARSFVETSQIGGSGSKAYEETHDMSTTPRAPSRRPPQ